MASKVEKMWLRSMGIKQVEPRLADSKMARDLKRTKKNLQKMLDPLTIVAYYQLGTLTNECLKPEECPIVVEREFADGKSDYGIVYPDQKKEIRSLITLLESDSWFEMPSFADDDERKKIYKRSQVIWQRDPNPHE